MEVEERLTHPCSGGLCFLVFSFVVLVFVVDVLFCFAELGMKPGPCMCARQVLHC